MSKIFKFLLLIFIFSVIHGCAYVVYIDSDDTTEDSFPEYTSFLDEVNKMLKEVDNYTIFYAKEFSFQAPDINSPWGSDSIIKVDNVNEIASKGHSDDYITVFNKTKDYYYSESIHLSNTISKYYANKSDVSINKVLENRSIYTLEAIFDDLSNKPRGVTKISDKEFNIKIDYKSVIFKMVAENLINSFVKKPDPLDSLDLSSLNINLKLEKGVLYYKAFIDKVCVNKENGLYFNLKINLKICDINTTKITSLAEQGYYLPKYDNDIKLIDEYYMIEDNITTFNDNNLDKYEPYFVKIKVDKGQYIIHKEFRGMNFVLLDSNQNEVKPYNIYNYYNLEDGYYFLKINNDESDESTKYDNFEIAIIKG